MKSHLRGFTLLEMIIAGAVILALSGVFFSFHRSLKEKSHQVLVLKKMKTLGSTLMTFTVERSGDFPLEEAAGTDDWINAAKRENADTWYNALPKMMGAMSVGELGVQNPVGLYDNAHPLFIPGAPYPSLKKRVSSPVFAIAMNSHLQPKEASQVQKQANMILIQEPSKTVVLLERVMVGDKKTMVSQQGYDGSPKAYARSFAARHAQKGCLIFADGHAQILPASSFLTTSGDVIVPQNLIVWTPNPEKNPN